MSSRWRSCRQGYGPWKGVERDGAGEIERAERYVCRHVNRHKADWAEARKAYEEAIRLDDQPIFKVFLAECLVQLGQISDAEAALQQIAQSGLEESELTDYVFAVTNLAIEFGDRNRLERAKDALNSIAPREPLFRARRDEYLITVHEALASGSSQKLKWRARSLLAGLTSSTTRYLVLRPTFMGILDSGAKRNALKRSGFERLFQARQSRLGRAS